MALSGKREEELQGEKIQQKKSNGASKAVFKVKNGRRERSREGQ